MQGSIILENTLTWGGKGNTSPCHLGGKIRKREEKKVLKCKRKREKEERKRKIEERKRKEKGERGRKRENGK
jgi:hypothetical protein